MKLAIFDLDGTLADTIEAIAYCSNRALRDLGFDSIETSQYKYFVGDGAEKLIKRALEASGDTKLLHYEGAMERYKKYFKEDCMYKVRPYDGILELLAELKEAGVQTAVLSNKPHARTLDTVIPLFGKDTFTQIQGFCDEIKPKPSPDGALMIAEQLGIAIEDCCYIGDTNTDMRTGKSAGMYTIGVLWGFRERKELEENHADAIISHPSELMILLKEKVN